MAAEPPRNDDPEQSDALEQLERALATTPPAAPTANPSAKEDPLLGAVLLDRVRIDAPIARGGMGRVYKGELLRLARTCAVKVLDPRLAGGVDAAGFARRFLLEASTAAKLTHPNVVTIYDYGEIEGRLFVSMRLINGRDLDSVLADGPLDPARAVRIIDQVAKALHAAHKVGLLHRDIKPSNILLDDDDFAYLIDFGIARGADETRLTKSGNTIGTFAYIAPERLDSRAEEDHRQCQSALRSLRGQGDVRPTRRLQMEHVDHRAGGPAPRSLLDWESQSSFSSLLRLG